MRTRDRDAWLEGADNPKADGEPATAMPRSRAAREEMEAALATVSADLVDRVLSRNHEEFLHSVRQTGGQ